MADAKLRRVCVVGSGSWGSTAAMIIARNVKRHAAEFESEVHMWVYEEEVNGRKLSHIINDTHENVKYLPGIQLPENIVAVPGLLDAVRDCDVLVFVLPHQFLPATCRTLKGHLQPNTMGISLIKGIDFDTDGVVLMSNVIEEELGIDMSVLSGANIASEIAKGKFCESTIGYRTPENGLLFYKLFNGRDFRISLIRDVVGPQVYGGLKNVMALGCGFCDALDMGNNTKSALMRIGLLEMQRFAALYFKGQVAFETAVASCGVADLITSCMGGRNRRVAEAFGRARGAETWDSLEAKLLNGQKLQGTGTCQEVIKILRRDGNVEAFPFINLIHRIAFEKAPVETIVSFPEEHLEDVIKNL